MVSLIRWENANQYIVKNKYLKQEENMKKKTFFVMIILSLSLTFSIFAYSQLIVEKSGDMASVNRILMAVSLPDSTTFKATLAEGGVLEIERNGDVYKFTPTIINIKSNSVNMELVEASSDSMSYEELINKSSSIQFEIIDIHEINRNKLKEKDSNKNCVTCCVTCNGWTACACAVEFEECNKSCCCIPCCPDEE